MNALEFENICLKIGSRQILDNISFSVKKGMIYGLIGHNGAGKTSLLRILLGLTVGFNGKIRILSDDDLNKQRIHIGAVMDSLSIDMSLSAEKYIHRVNALLGIDSPSEEKKHLERVGLTNTGKMPVSKFSLGMKRRLMIAGALIGSPDILVLDEPFNGIDPEGMAAIRLVLQQLSAEGVTVLVTSHNIPELIKLSTAFGVMHKGSFVDSITSDELAAKYVCKTVFKTNNPQLLMNQLTERLGAMDCFANSPGEISVFGELDDEQCSRLSADITEAKILNISKSRMSEEEFLLWRMNGYTG